MSLNMDVHFCIEASTDMRELPENRRELFLRWMSPVE